MMPPTSIDGTDITGATIDGTDVTEITLDGNTVFTAAPDIPDSAIAQYDATQLSGLTDGDPVSTFQDSVGTNDASAVGNPTYKTNVQNGKPVVRYDGIDDYHNTGITFDTGTDRSLIVALRESSTGGQTFYGSLDTGADNGFIVQDGGNGNYFGYFGDTNRSGGTPDTNFHIITIIGNSGSAVVRLDGVQVVSFSYTANGTTLSHYLGARNLNGSADTHLGGDIGEAVEYNEALSTSDRDNEESRMADKWGVTLP